MNNRYANPFTRPQTFGVQPQFSAAPNPYAMSQQWPAATSTELWTHQQQMAQYQSDHHQQITIKCGHLLYQLQIIQQQLCKCYQLHPAGIRILIKLIKNNLKKYIFFLLHK